MDLVPDVQKIGVLRANSLGDYLFTLPALDALRAAYPDAEIVLLGAPWHARELAGRPGPVDRVLVVPPWPGVRDGEPDALLPAARRERFDLLLQLHGGGRHTNPLVREIGARVTVGLRAEDAPPLDRWVRYVQQQSEIIRHLEVVSLVGARPVTLEPVFPLTDEDRAEAAALAPSGRRVVLHPGANDARRRWPPERFAEVGDALADAGFAVLVTGTDAEGDLVGRVGELMRHPSRSLAGRLSVGGLAALLSGCALVVANDTGPLHLAEAVGAATVGVYWAPNVLNYAPLTRLRHRPIPSWRLHCPQCGADLTREVYPARPGDGCAHREPLVTDVPVAEVLAAAFDLLGPAWAGVPAAEAGLPAGVPAPRDQIRSMTADVERSGT